MLNVAVVRALNKSRSFSDPPRFPLWDDFRIVVHLAVDIHHELDLQYIPPQWRKEVCPLVELLLMDMLTVCCSKVKNDCRAHHLNGYDRLLSHTSTTEN